MKHALRIEASEFQRDTYVLLNEYTWRLINHEGGQPGAYLGLKNSEILKLRDIILVAPRALNRDPETHAFVDGHGWLTKDEFNPEDAGSAEFYLGKISNSVFPDREQLEEQRRAREKQRAKSIKEAEENFDGVKWSFFEKGSSSVSSILSNLKKRNSDDDNPDELSTQEAQDQETQEAQGSLLQKIVRRV